MKNPFVWTARTMRQWYAIWFPLGTVIADRGYLGCSYSWCIINVGLTWPSRSTRIRGIAAKRPTADGPYKDLYYLCMCTGSLFQDKRRPGTRSPSAYDPRKHGPSFAKFRRITVCQRPHKGCIRGYLRHPSAVFPGFYRRRNSSCFIPPIVRVPKSRHRWNAWVLL